MLRLRAGKHGMRCGWSQVGLSVVLAGQRRSAVGLGRPRVCKGIHAGCIIIDINEHTSRGTPAATQVNALTANETVRKSLSNFYRCLKTLHLLKNLYLAEALPKQVYSEELSDVQEKLLLLRETLKGHDLQRFSQLWDVEAEFAAFNPEALKSEIRVPISVAKISNFVPQMIDAVLNGENYSDVYEVLSNFTRELAKLRDSEKNLTPLLLRTMDSIASM